MYITIFLSRAAFFDTTTLAVPHSKVLLYCDVVGSAPYRFRRRGRKKVEEPKVNGKRYKGVVGNMYNSYYSWHRQKKHKRNFGTAAVAAKFTRKKLVETLPPPNVPPKSSQPLYASTPFCMLLPYSQPSVPLSAAHPINRHLGVS